MVKNNLLLSIIVIVLLAGCATTQPGIKVEIQKVEIPVAVPCKAVVPVAPSFNFDKLTTDKDIFVKNQAMLADRLLHLGYEAELAAALSSCIK